MSKKPDHPIAWTWKCDFCLRGRVEHTREELLRYPKPWLNAKLVCVRLVPNVEYRKLVREKKDAASAM